MDKIMQVGIFIILISFLVKITIQKKIIMILLLEHLPKLLTHFIQQQAKDPMDLGIKKEHRKREKRKEKYLNSSKEDKDKEIQKLLVIFYREKLLQYGYLFLAHRLINNILQKSKISIRNIFKMITKFLFVEVMSIHLSFSKYRVVFLKLLLIFNLHKN